MIPDGLGCNSPILTLVEAFMKVERDESVLMSPNMKRARSSLDEDPTIPLITVSRPCQPSMSSGTPTTPIVNTGSSPLPNVSAGVLSQALITAIKCWDLLNSSEQLRAGNQI